MFPIGPPLIDGLPNYIIAYLRWMDLPSPTQFDQTTVLKLPQTSTPTKYEAQEPTARYTLGGEVLVDVDAATATLIIRPYINGESDEWEEWRNVPIGELPHWSSPMVEAVTTPGQDIQQMRIWT